MRYAELNLSAQTAYAELFEQVRAFELSRAISGLSGSFHLMPRKGRSYWYFAYKDVDQSTRMVYVGPDDDRLRKIVQERAERPPIDLTAQARASINLGCAATTPKHFRVIKRLADYGFFRAGGLLIGTHAFIALANMLGVRWNDGSLTLDVDFAHAGRNVSVALPADMKINVHSALESLEMGLLPIAELDGRLGAQYRNPSDPELRLDFVTSLSRSRKPIVMRELNLALEPLKFMEFSLEGTTQGCVLANQGAALVNLPSPERYAVHKLIVYGERPVRERAKAKKDLLQAAALASYFNAAGDAELFNAAWKDALSRGRGWKTRAREGQKALLNIAPELEIHALWRET